MEKFSEVEWTEPRLYYVHEADQTEVPSQPEDIVLTVEFLASASRNGSVFLLLCNFRT